MSEVAALAKHACPACGAEAVWTPAQQALVCPFCGTTSPATLGSDGTLVQEHDLVAALQAIPDEQRGFGSDRTPVQCQSCQAISLFEPERVAQRCEFCGSPSVVPYEQARNAIRPESLLPFVKPEPEIREAMRQWYAGRWFAPNALGKAALTDQVHGVYVPYWTFDALAEAHWTAEAGYHYYVPVQRTVNGRTETVQEQRTRWEHASGHVQMHFDDELVPATLGLKPKLLRQIEPFPTQEVVPYDPGYVSGWVVEQYQIDLIAAAEKARDQMQSKVRSECASKVPGDTHRNLQVDASYDHQTFKHILAPVWVLTYNYGARSFQVLVNGVTGEIAGERPYSWMKIVGAVLGVLLALLLLLMVAGCSSAPAPGSADAGRRTTGAGTPTSAAGPGAAQSGDPQHENLTAPHGDHTPHKGGLVFMNGDVHYELVMRANGRHEVWFSDSMRNELPATVVRGVTLVVTREGEPVEAVQLSVDDSGESWRAAGRAVTTDTAMVKVQFSLDGEPHTVEVPFVAATTP